MSVFSPAISSSKFTPTPPEKGSFPLDRYGQCKELVRKYLECMKSNRNEIEKCRALSKDYLECRMNKSLMARDSWTNLGFQPDEIESLNQDKSNMNVNEENRKP